MNGVAVFPGVSLKRSKTDSENSQMTSLVPAWPGWDITPAIEWLLNDGRRETDILEFTDRLCDSLVHAGAPIQSLKFGFQALHPLVSACAFTWSVEHNTTEACIPHAYSVTDQIAISGDEIRPPSASPASGKRSLVMPLILSTDEFSTLVVEVSPDHEPSIPDREKFQFIARLLAPTLDALTLRRVAVTVLETYVGVRAGQRVLEGHIRRGDSEKILAAIWMCDLRDSTHISSTLEPAQMIQMMNEYFEIVFNAITKNRGEVLRFIGDAVLAVFPDDSNSSVHTVCEHAYQAALDAINNRDDLNYERRKRGLLPVDFGVGLNYGEVVYGNIGAPTRLDFSIMGVEVNIAARIEELTKQLDYPVLMSRAVARAINSATVPVGRFDLKGIDKPQRVYAPRLSTRHAVSSHAPAYPTYS